MSLCILALWTHNSTLDHPTSKAVLLRSWWRSMVLNSKSLKQLQVKLL